MTFREVDDALISVQKSREQLVALGRRVKALDDYARLARLRYDGGYSSYIEVLDAQRFLFDAKLDYVAVQGNVYSSLIGTYKAMGGGWVIEAQRDADETDFPGEESDSESSFAFPKPTHPSGVEKDLGYQ